MTNEYAELFNWERRKGQEKFEESITKNLPQSIVLKVEGKAGWKEMDGDEFSTRKAKGLTRSIVNQLSFDDYVNCLFRDVNFEPAFNKVRKTYYIYNWGK